MNAIPSTWNIFKFASSRAFRTARGYCFDVNEACWSHETALVPYYVDVPVWPCKALSHQRVHAYERRFRGVTLPFHVKKEQWTHLSSCLSTTFDRILRSEVTTAAHVSSAEDSSASTVNRRNRGGFVTIFRRDEEKVTWLGLT